MRSERTSFTFPLHLSFMRWVGSKNAPCICAWSVLTVRSHNECPLHIYAFHQSFPSAKAELTRRAFGERSQNINRLSCADWELLPHYCPYIASVKIGRKTCKLLTRTSSTVSCIITFSQSVTPSENLLCILIFQICCHSQTVNVPKWLSLILVLLANDIEVNPGPHEKNCLTFMNWNLNSLVKGNFERVDLIEAQTLTLGRLLMVGLGCFIKALFQLSIVRTCRLAKVS